jgi:hypothetical protein
MERYRKIMNKMALCLEITASSRIRSLQGKLWVEKFAKFGPSIPSGNLTISFGSDVVTFRSAVLRVRMHAPVLGSSIQGPITMPQDKQMIDISSFL